MDNFWMLLTFAIGGFAGFLVFAILQMSRGSDGKRQAVVDPILLSIDLEGDTLSRM